MRGIIAVVLTASLLSLAACGQKGPLYLPGSGSDGGQDQPQQQPGDAGDHG